ncbi:MAG: Stk1 family PASTA domain-containing Ser/Thr kinase, partial [Candidatus Ornithomonoglobus sp.]
MLNTENLIGTVLSDRYEVLEKIGTGGMATVYKAHDKVLDRDVAIKILRENFEGNSEIVENFIKEARSSASLVHPNVVSVYDVCTYGEINYMVMELVDGITLKKYIKKNPRLPWQEACDYAIQIAQGIQAAHERNIIHRDIKPQNIIMAPGGVLKVTDFGIAKAMESDTSMAGGTATGSVHYISPEQARGGFTDFRSDIYSLGICLYEMLAGRVPFDGDSPVSVALMHIEEEPVNVKCVNIDVPADLAYVTMKAMNRDPNKRYQNMNELLDDLRAVLADEDLPSKESEKQEKEDAENTDASNGAAQEVREKKPVGKEDLANRGRSNTRVKNKKKMSAKKKREDRNSVILALSTVAVIVLVAVGVVLMLINPFSGNSVPDLAGLTLEEAAAAAHDAGYKINDEIEYSLSDDVAENLVISQLPEAGTAADKSEPISLVVSLGASNGGVPVPDVVNMDIDEAGQIIEARTLLYKIVLEPSTEVAENLVIRQIPAPGTHLNPGDYVTLHMSTGPDADYSEKGTVTVPSVIGMYRDNAESTLGMYNLLIGTVTRKASNNPEGTIIMQSPAAGASVSENTTVTIVISSGREDSTLASEY